MGNTIDISTVQQQFLSYILSKKQIFPINSAVAEEKFSQTVQQALTAATAPAAEEVLSCTVPYFFIQELLPAIYSLLKTNEVELNSLFQISRNGVAAAGNESKLSKMIRIFFSSYQSFMTAKQFTCILVYFLFYFYQAITSNGNQKKEEGEEAVAAEEPEVFKFDALSIKKKLTDYQYFMAIVKCIKVFIQHTVTESQAYPPFVSYSIKAATSLEPVSAADMDEQPIEDLLTVVNFCLTYTLSNHQDKPFSPILRLMLLEVQNEWFLQMKDAQAWYSTQGSKFAEEEEEVGAAPLDVERLLVDKEKLYNENNEVLLTTMAQQLTVRQYELFSKMKSFEFFGKNWRNKVHKGPQEVLGVRCPNIMRMLKEFDHVAQWTSQEIVLPKEKEKRASRMKYFLKLCQKLYDLRNYQVLFAIIAGILSAPVFRLNETKALLTEEEMAAIERFRELVSLRNDFQTLRATLNSCDNNNCVPYFGMLMGDLKSMHDYPVHGQIGTFYATLRTRYSLQELPILVQVPTLEREHSIISRIENWQRNLSKTVFASAKKNSKFVRMIDFLIDEKNLRGFQDLYNESLIREKRQQ